MLCAITPATLAFVWVGTVRGHPLRLPARGSGRHLRLRAHGTLCPLPPEPAVGHAAAALSNAVEPRRLHTGVGGGSLGLRLPSRGAPSRGTAPGDALVRRVRRPRGRVCRDRPRPERARPRRADDRGARFFALNILGVTSTSYLLLQYFVRERERALVEPDPKHSALEVERSKSERLLLNVLPEPVANRLKESEAVIADALPGVTVTFADIVGFTPFAEGLAPDEVVRLLDRVSHAGMRSPPGTGWRRSRPSATPTWWPAASPCHGWTMRRRSPGWRSRCVPSLRDPRRTESRRSRRGSG